MGSAQFRTRLNRACGWLAALCWYENLLTDFISGRARGWVYPDIPNDVRGALELACFSKPDQLDGERIENV